LLTLYGHLDTVPPEGNERPEVAGDRVSGRGTVDMKGGLTVMLALLEDDDVRAGPYDVAAVFYDREEGPAHLNGLEDVLDAVPWLAGSELGVVLEPTDLELQLGCQGALNATVSFLGRSAHSARPWLGENAVTKAGTWLAGMHARRPETVVVGGLEFKELFSVTTARGGTARNVIPGRFELNLNYRFPPDRTLDEAEARLRAVADEADDVEIVDRAAAGAVPEGNRHVDRLARVSGAPRTAKQAWTDVARLGARGIPAVNFGPGEVALAHRADESTPVEHLERAFTALRAFLVE
jgi:succinyl-diaminopimelate desuccinylase